MSDRLPELYDLAYAMYKGEGEQLYRQLSALRNAGADELDRYLTALDIQNAERDYADAQERQAYERAWNEEARSYERGEAADARAWKQAAEAAAYGDWSGLEALGVKVDERLKNQPALTLAQVNAAIKEGNLAPKVLEAWEYYYGAPYAAAEPTPAGYVPPEEPAPRSDAPDPDAGTDLPVDQSSVLALGYGPISAERLSELIAEGAVESYESDGVLRFRRTGASAPALRSRFTDRFTERFG